MREDARRQTPRERSSFATAGSMRGRRGVHRRRRARVPGARPPAGGFSREGSSRALHPVLERFRRQRGVQEVASGPADQPRPSPAGSRGWRRRTHRTEPRRPVRRRGDEAAAAQSRSAPPARSVARLPLCDTHAGVRVRAPFGRRQPAQSRGCPGDTELFLPGEGHLEYTGDETGKAVGNRALGRRVRAGVHVWR